MLYLQKQISQDCAFDVFPVDISRIVKLHYKLIDNKFLKKTMITFLLAEIPLFFCNSYFGCYVCSFFFSLSIQCFFFVDKTNKWKFTAIYHITL